MALKSELKKSKNLISMSDMTAAAVTTSGVVALGLPQQQQQQSQPPINSKFIRHIIGEKLKKEANDLGLAKNADELRKASGGGERPGREKTEASEDSVS